MGIRNKIVLACVLCTATVGTSLPLYADNAGAFIGGVFATKVVDNMNRRTAAEEQQAAAAQAQPVNRRDRCKRPLQNRRRSSVWQNSTSWRPVATSRRKSTRKRSRPLSTVCNMRVLLC